MSTYYEQLQGLANRFFEETGAIRATKTEIAAWMVREGLWQPSPELILNKAAEDLARAMREDYYVDPQGRHVRAKHAARVVERTACRRRSGPISASLRRSTCRLRSSSGASRSWPTATSSRPMWTPTTTTGSPRRQSGFRLTSISISRSWTRFRGFLSRCALVGQTFLDFARRSPSDCNPSRLVPRAGPSPLIRSTPQPASSSRRQPPHPYQVSMQGRFLAPPRFGAGTERRPRETQRRDSIGSITSSISKWEAVFTALPRS